MRDFTFEEEPFVPFEQDTWGKVDHLMVKYKVSYCTVNQCLKKHAIQ